MSRQFVGLDKPGPATMERRRGGRATERLVAATAIGLAAVFVLLALLSVFAPRNLGLGPWLPVHLLLAGAATTAIAGVMPFFSSAITNAPPAAGWLRFAAVVAVAAGALTIVIGRIVSPALVSGNSWIAGAGGVVFIFGLTLVMAATLSPLRLALGGRRVVIGFIYGMALVNVVGGAALASVLLLGWLPALQHWPALKPAHAWLNVFGFVSLVIAGTLLHLLPTVWGTRITNSKAGLVAAAGVALGSPLAALGFIAGIGGLALGGAVVVTAGAVALAAYAFDVVRRGFEWRTDHSWHRFSSWSMLAAIGWFIVACVSAAWTVWTGGSTPAGWQLEPLVAPLFVGWVGQVLVAAWTHLVPAVGPGQPPRHAAQRQILGRAGMARLVLANSGVALMVAGTITGISPALIAGFAAVLIAAVAALTLLVASLAVREQNEK